MPHSVNALELLRQDHRHLQALLQQLEDTEVEDEQRELCERIVSELSTHAEIEEKVFYPFLRAATDREDLFHEASIEHGFARELLERLPREQPGTPQMRAVVKVLADQIGHHVEEEENEIFPEVENTGVDLEALGMALQECRQALTGETAAEGDQGDQVDQGNECERQAGGRFVAHDAEEDERFMAEHAQGLSKSTLRAKWVNEPGEEPDRDGQTLATRSLEVIEAWADARGARPATSPGGDAERPRVLRLDFPDFGGGNLQPVEWEAWGRDFEERGLVFLFQETKSDGRQSNFFRLDSPEREDG